MITDYTLSPPPSLSLLNTNMKRITIGTQFHFPVLLFKLVLNNNQPLAIHHILVVLALA